MMMEYLDIFPTRIYKYSIDKDLIDYVLDNYQFECDRFSINNILNEPEFLNLQNEVLDKVIDDCPHGVAISDWKVITSWINNQPSGHGGFKYHSHTDSFMSCVLYLKGTDMYLSFKDSPRESPVSMADKSCNYDIVVRHTYHSEVNVPVNVGDLLLFPSYILHQPNENITDRDRVSIAYNLMPCRSKKDSTIAPWIMDLQL